MNSLTSIKSIQSSYTTNDIFILGKGSSVDSLDLTALSSSLVIGLNDSEWIHPCDISLFHESWVLDSISDNGYLSSIYICPFSFSPPNSCVYQSNLVDLVSPDIDGDLLMSRLLRDIDFSSPFLERILFLSALRLALYIANERKCKQNIYMIGFDFTAHSGYSKSIPKDYSPNGPVNREIRISPQEYYFTNALYMLRDSPIKVLHVGSRFFSSLNSREFNASFGSLAIPPQSKSHSVSIVAELTTNHFGDRNRLEKMVRACKSAGADYIKVQKRDVDSFYSKEQLDGKYISPFGTTFREYRHALELTYDDFVFLDNLCLDLGIPWFASILDRRSLEFIQPFNLPFIKLPSTISEYKDYLDYVASSFYDSFIISTGMTDSSYEQWVLDRFRHAKTLYLMQCTSAYPTPPYECDVAVIRRYSRLQHSLPNIIPAYSSHDSGWFASSLAVAAGAKMVEKHVKWGNTDWAHFDAVALDLCTDEFSTYVSKVREAEVILGSEEKVINSSESHKYYPPSHG